MCLYAIVFLNSSKLLVPGIINCLFNSELKTFLLTVLATSEIFYVTDPASVILSLPYYLSTLRSVKDLNPSTIFPLLTERDVAPCYSVS